MQRSAVIYVRVSSARQIENYSLSVQDEACRAYCRAQGWPVARVFREEGESAATTERTQLTALLDYVCEHKRELVAIVVHSVSRWARDTRDHLNLRATLERWGVALRSATEPINETDEGQLVETFLAGIARFENRQRARRTVAGMRKALETGRWTFRAPLGYLNSGRGNAREPSLSPNPATARLVHAIFDGFVRDGLSEHEVQRRITGRGFRLPDGKPVSLQTVSKTLRNAAYAGRLSLPDWGIDVRGDWEPLVDEGTFNRAQARFAAPKAHARLNDDFPLRTFARCGECGGPLTGALSRGRGKRYGYYWCKPCRREHRWTGVSKVRLEAAFVDLLVGLQPRAEYMALVNAVVRDVWRQRESSVRGDRERLE